MTNKYHNTRCEMDGFTFASKAERRRYIDLILLKQAKLIKSFTMQPKFELYAGIKYIGDFLVTGNDGTEWVEDVKGIETEVFKIKAKLFRDKYPGTELRIIK